MNTKLPTLVWTHGGAWISGSKADAAPYYEIVASQGYAVISLNYSLAPHKTYPTPIQQVNDAPAYIQQHADRFHVGADQIIMGGSSAGAQITSQMAILITSPEYAIELRLTPSLPTEQLGGVILYSGIYDLVTLRGDSEPNPMGLMCLLRWGTGVAVCAYSGSRDRDTPELRQMSLIHHVPADFPPALISGGNGDSLTDPHSCVLADRLNELGVEVTTLFYPAEHVLA